VSKIIYTIGYAGIKLPQFITVLKEQGVTLLVDVRSMPRSKYFPDFNDTTLAQQLIKNGIRYGNWKVEFGARQEDAGLFTDGVLDFDKFAQSKQFKQGIEKLDALVSKSEVVCLMCAEIDPIGCHRFVLISKHLCYNGYDVQHIVARTKEVKIESQKDLEARLLKLYCKQPSLLQDELELAYRKQNQKIGYNLNNKK
jgi:uncharacterized protein (DUF488 family)